MALTGPEGELPEPTTAAEREGGTGPEATTPSAAGEAGAPASEPEPTAPVAAVRGASAAGPAGQGPAGSIADLKARLARLPAGHPASPYDDAGRPRPAPIRLRQLELGLPARPAGATRYPDLSGSDTADDLGPGPAVSRASTTAAAETKTEVTVAAATTAARERDRAPTAAPPRDNPGQNDGSALGPAPRRDRHPTGDATALRRQSPNSSEERSAPDRNGTGGNGGSPDRNGTGGNGGSPDWQRPHGPAADADHPGNGSAVAPAGVSRLTAPQRELVDRVVLACRAAEGRNAVGGYGSSGLTPALLRIAAQLPVGGLASGSEADTLKPAGRFAAKLARLLARQPGRPAEQLAASISDGIRYAFVFDAAAYTEGTMLVHRKLKAQGFDLEARRNQWNSPEYKGVFTRWHDPAHGLPFEVQFHTDQSWAVVKRMHDAYVQITDPATPPAERARLRAEQARAEESVPQPSGWTNIGDVRADAGAAAMPSDVEYYVIVSDQRGRAAGLARRKLAAKSGPVDETLSRDLSWRPDSAIVEWEYGDLGAELVRIDDQEAENLTQVFRTRWQPS